MTAESDAVKPQGREWCVSFVHDGRRHNLGTFPTHREATDAYRRRLRAITAAVAEKYVARSEKMTPGHYRDRSSPIANERMMTPDALALLMEYDPLTGRLEPRIFDDNTALRMRLGDEPACELPRVHWRGLPLYRHRVAWCLGKNAWPRGRVTWKNGRQDDLRLSNLRCDAEIDDL